MKPKTASLAMFIAEECAGYVGGRCIEHEDGGGPCTVIDGRTRCPYLERCVLPIATRGLRKQRLVSPRDDAPAVAECLRIQRRLDGRQTKPCPDCGKPIPKRSRVCPTCRQRRRRATFRRSQKKQRSLSTVSPLQVVSGQ